MGIQVFANQGADPFGVQKQATTGKIFGIWKKYSSHKPLARTHWYLVWNIHPRGHSVI